MPFHSKNERDDDDDALWWCGLPLTQKSKACNLSLNFSRIQRDEDGAPFGPVVHVSTTGPKMAGSISVPENARQSLTEKTFNIKLSLEHIPGFSGNIMP